ncbi:MAG TPA: ATP-binding protein [Azospirillum sp.]
MTRDAETAEERILRLERRVAELEAERAGAEAPLADLHASEARLRDREELFALVMRGPNDGLWDWNPVTKALFLSARLLSIIGFDSDTLHTSTHEWLKIVHPDDRAAYEAKVAEHLKGLTEHFEAEYRVAGPDGAYRWVLSRGLALRGPDGRAYRMAGSIADITEIKRREGELRASEARFRSLIRTAGSIILVLDGDGVVVEANREAERAFGGSSGSGAGSTVGRSWRALIDEPPDGSFAYQLTVAGTGREIRNFEHAGRDLAGGERVILWNMNRLPEAAGAGAAIICVGQDITRRKRMELALRQAHDELEMRVEERTRDMLHAKEQAEIANRAKSEFLANMSHELRTPLNAIIGFASMMESQLIGPLGNPKYQEYARVIVKSSGHLLAVINDILDVAKIEAGKFEIHPQPMDMRDAVESSVMLIGERAFDGGIDVQAEVAEDTPPVMADGVRVKQILLNLLANAVKFTPEGGRVRLSVRPDGHGRVLAEVSDTGIGMSAEGIALAMEPFGQVDSHLARRAGGTGLGLPLVRSFVDLHGGTLEIESAEGQGTTVRVYLPVAVGVA